MNSQKTVAAPLSFSGIGLHTGTHAHLRITPAPPDTGIVFLRTDLDNFRIEACFKNVAKVSYATTLMKQGVWISTVEHLLSPLYALGIDNVFIEIDNLEVPILDGSSLPFVEKILAAGIKKQARRRRYLAIRKAVHIRHHEKHISIRPADHFQVQYSIDFPHPLIHKQSRGFEPAAENFAREISPARTFGFIQEVEELRKNGLIRGGSLENALVLTPDGLLNGPLRFSDEFVRHKILDCLGDVSLIGYPILGRIVASRTGHAMHTELVAKIIADKASWKLVELEEPRSHSCPCKAEALSAPAS